MLNERFVSLSYKRNMEVGGSVLDGSFTKSLGTQALVPMLAQGYLMVQNGCSVLQPLCMHSWQ